MIKNVNSRSSIEYSVCTYLQEYVYPNLHCRNAFCKEGQIKFWIDNVKSYHPVDFFVCGLKEAWEVFECSIHCHEHLGHSNSDPYPLNKNLTCGQIRQRDRIIIDSLKKILA